MRESRSHPSPPSQSPPTSPDQDQSKAKELKVDLTAVNQLWPQLQAVVEPFGLKPRPQDLDEEGASKVREEADDLRDNRPEPRVKGVIGGGKGSS